MAKAKNKSKPTTPWNGKVAISIRKFQEIIIENMKSAIKPIDDPEHYRFWMQGIKKIDGEDWCRINVLRLSRYNEEGPPAGPPASVVRDALKEWIYIAFGRMSNPYECRWMEPPEIEEPIKYYEIEEPIKYYKGDVGENRENMEHQAPGETEYIPKRQFQTWQFCIKWMFRPPMQSVICQDGKLLARIHKVLKSGEWQHGVSVNRVCVSKLYKVGEEVLTRRQDGEITRWRGGRSGITTQRKPSRHRYYFISSYRTGMNMGQFRLMRDDGVMSTSGSIYKIVDFHDLPSEESNANDTK